MTDDLFSSQPPPCPKCKRELKKCAKLKDCAEQVEFNTKARESFEALEWGTGATDSGSTSAPPTTSRD